MEIRIFNFGPIKEFGIDLSRDLIVTYGKNNIGKSYAISVVYLLLKHFLGIDRFQLEKLIAGEITDEKCQALEKQIREEKECDITGPIGAIIKNILNCTLAERFENSFKNTFGQLNTLKNVNAKESPLIQLTILNHAIHIEVGKNIQVKEFYADRPIFGKIPGDGKYSLDITKDSYTLLIGTDKPIFNEFLRVSVSELILKMLNGIESQFGQIYFLPASRSGLYTGMQSLIPLFADLSKNRAYTTRKIELPAMTEPIADYILHLSGIMGIPTENKELNSIVSTIEKEILGGEIGFDKDKTKLTYSPIGSGLTLDMNFVSSMVSELSPFAAFIKFILREESDPSDNMAKPVIFIEEPEAHLHPQAQVLMAEIFVKLVKAGLKIIVTSHSNYIFNKIGNMLLAGTLSPGEFAPIVLKDTRDGSISRLMEADQLGIEDENFIDIADALYQERELIIDLLNNASDDR